MMEVQVIFSKRQVCIALLTGLLLLQTAWLMMLCTNQAILRPPCDGCDTPKSQHSMHQTEDDGSENNDSSHDLKLYSDEPLPNTTKHEIDGRAVDLAFSQLLGSSDPRKSIFLAKYDLVWLYVPHNITSSKGDPYRGVKASFCPVNWQQQKTEPNTVPRYRNAHKASSKCSHKNPLSEVVYDFQDIARMTRRYDALATKSVKVRNIPTAGFIFHESRAGSTLVANMLTVGNPDTSRVYSEPDVLRKAMKTNNTQLVKDVLYMLGRTRTDEKRVFYKLKSEAVRHIESLPSKIPWIFLYREPNDVMASHFHPTEYNGSTVCLNERYKPHSITKQVGEAFGYPDVNQTSNETFCALRLASLCDSAIRRYEQTNSGRFVNYNTLPASLWESIAPDHFGLRLSQSSIERMKNISGVYSKGRTNKIFEWDETSKTSLISKEQKQAANKILQPFYKEMEKLSKRKTSKKLRKRMKMKILL